MPAISWLLFVTLVCVATLSATKDANAKARQINKSRSLLPITLLALSLESRPGSFLSRMRAKRLGKLIAEWGTPKHSLKMPFAFVALMLMRLIFVQ
jgi:hypothetical protein